MESQSEDEHVKTVYAHFGLAIYLSQCLEHGLSNALVFMELVPARAHKVRTNHEWASEFDSFIGRSFEKTLGGLIRNLKDISPLPQDLESNLSLALKRRNWLAHHYFRESADKLVSASGRNEMIAELERDQALFQAADDSLSQVLKPIREKYGFTDEKIESMLNARMSALQNDL